MSVSTFAWSNLKQRLAGILGIFWNNWIRLVDAIPLIQPMASFSRDSHRKAFIKWFVLVMAASAPVLLTVLLSPIPAGDLSLWEKMIKKLSESIPVSEQFVYSAAFLAPTLYLFWEKYLDLQDSQNRKTDHTSYEKLQKAMKIYRGYGWIFVFSIAVLSMTAIGYSFIKTENKTFNTTFLFNILHEYSWLIYAFALYAFYLSIVSENGTDYTSTIKSDEQAVTAGLGDRVNKENAQ